MEIFGRKCLYNGGRMSHREKETFGNCNKNKIAHTLRSDKKGRKMVCFTYPMNQLSDNKY